MNPSLKSFSLKLEVWEERRLAVFRPIKCCGRDVEDCLLITLHERLRALIVAKEFQALCSEKCYRGEKRDVLEKSEWLSWGLHH